MRSRTSTTCPPSRCRRRSRSRASRERSWRVCSTEGITCRSRPPRCPDSGLLRSWLVARGLEEAPGFDFLSLGLLAYVGQEEVLNQVMVGDVPLFNYSGKIAFALWRTVYLTKQASTRNQALIAFDWLRTETFGRDITRL